MYKLGVALIFWAISLSTYSFENALVLSKSVFKTTLLQNELFVVPSEDFEEKLIAEEGVFKNTVIGGNSENSSYYLTDVDDLRYENPFAILLGNIPSGKNNIELISKFSPALDVTQDFRISRFSLAGNIYNGFIIAGKNKRQSNQFIYELFFIINNNLYSLTYYSTMGFEQVFT